MITKATYNITNDKLQFWPAERLSETDYARVKRAGFAWWPGRKCFAAKWSTYAEDIITEFGGVIDDDDQPDDVESRVERFSERADKEVQSAENAQNYLDGDRANTERRRANGARAVEKSLDKAQHWKERIAGAIRNAAMKERPDVIKRRIDGLEKDRRKEVASYTPQPDIDGAKYGSPNCVFVGNKGRGGYWLDKDKLPAAKLAAERWIAHYDRRLEYERACLAAAGGIITDEKLIQVGGKVLAYGEWVMVVKVSKSSATGKVVSVTVDKKPGRHWNYKIEIEHVADYTPPTGDDIKAAKKVTKLPPLVNYQGEGFEHITKAEYDRYVLRGSGAARTVAATPEHGEHRQRRIQKIVYGGGGLTMVYITDIPTKARPKPEKVAAPDVPEPAEETIEQAAARELEAATKELMAQQH